MRPIERFPRSRSADVGAGFLAAVALAAMTGGLFAEEVGSLYRQKGSDPGFEEVMRGGDLPRGRNSTTGVKGSEIKVDRDLIVDGPNARRDIPGSIKIHTLGNSVIPRSAFGNWSRWYQEDGNTQIFRLFEGEENVRNSRKLAARVEAFSELKWKRGGWHEWVGTYTIIKPHGAAIFQAKNNENDWSVQLNMNDEGDIVLNHRRGTDKVIARDMVGKPFHVRVRDNGHDYEVYLNGVKQGTGSYARPQGYTNFRWGMYLGANEVRHDAMIFVTGAGIDPKDYRSELARVAGEPASETERPREGAPEGLAIPERVWTNHEGGSIRAPGVYAVGEGVVRLRVEGRWVKYPLEKLSEADRAALKQAMDFKRE